MRLKVLEVQQSILRKNATLAAELRERFERQGTLVVNMLSSPGSGKTTLLERTLEHLANRYRVAALVGDQATDNDAVRLSRAGVPVRQIATGAECRLDAAMIADALEAWNPGSLDALFVENVGNLICPAEYDLGEDLRVVLFAVTEGEDKPLKYPLAFNTSHAALLTKIDLLPHLAFDAGAAARNIDRVHAEVPVLELSALTGEGMDGWFTLIESRLQAKRGYGLVPSPSA